MKRLFGFLKPHKPLLIALIFVNVLLSAMQTLWVREHNRIALLLRLQDPALTGNEIYERARSRVTAQIQAIPVHQLEALAAG